MPVDQQLNDQTGLSADVQVVPSGGGRLEFKGKVSGLRCAPRWTWRE